jgi:hypothetical protein
MNKRMILLAAALIASLAFATPTHAASTDYQDITIINLTGGATFGDVTVTFGGVTSFDAGSVSVSVSSTAPPGSYAGSFLVGANSVEVFFTQPVSAVDMNINFSDGTDPILQVLSGQANLSLSSPLGTPGTGSLASTRVIVANDTVPEPSSFGILGIGISGFFAYRRVAKRRRAMA